MKKILYYGTTILLVLYCVFYFIMTRNFHSLRVFNPLINIGIALIILSVIAKIMLIIHFKKNKEDCSYKTDSLCFLLHVGIFILLIMITNVY